MLFVYLISNATGWLTYEYLKIYVDATTKIFLSDKYYANALELPTESRVSSRTVTSTVEDSSVLGSNTVSIGTYSSSVGATARCGLWPVEQYFSIFFLSITNSLHLLTPNTWRSLATSSLHPFLGLPLRLAFSSSWVKIFLGILSSSILSRWPSQLILCPFIYFTIFSPFVQLF